MISKLSDSFKHVINVLCQSRQVKCHPHLFSCLNLVSLADNRGKVICSRLNFELAELQVILLRLLVGFLDLSQVFVISDVFNYFSPTTSGLLTILSQVFAFHNDLVQLCDAQQFFWSLLSALLKVRIGPLSSLTCGVCVLLLEVIYLLTCFNHLIEPVEFFQLAFVHVKEVIGSGVFGD